MAEVKKVALTEDHYARIWEEECHNKYPVIDKLETKWGYTVGKERLESAARVLACPFKMHAPNWQHGRVLYTVARVYLSRMKDERVCMLDIGTAKGFSALVMKWAIDDAGVLGRITSVDVIDPDERVRRNTVVEVEGLKTLGEILAPWPESREIVFRQMAGVSFLSGHSGRVHFAFVDGKHRYDHVHMEGGLLRMKQESGDVVIFDDVQIDGVRRAVNELHGYKKHWVELNAERQYCIATRE